MDELISREFVLREIEAAQKSLESDNDVVWELNKKFFKGLAWANRIIRDAPAIEIPMKWISVKDRLPVTGNVLATDGQIIITAPSSSVRNRKSITHWMPLPELPKEGAENDRTETR